MSKISIIIPTYNEELIIEKQLTKLFRIKGDCEIILVDSSDDKTKKIASKFNLIIVKSKKGRALQMNNGAKIATGDILYFLHIDTCIPYNFQQIIMNHIENRIFAGCFQMKFNDNHWLMNFYGWCTRFPFSICRGGDQSLFITKELFQKLDGFDEKLIVMEDIEIIKRIKKYSKFIITPQKVITSARKYKVNGKIRLQIIFGIIHLMYNLGYSQQKIVQFYRSKVR